MLITQKILEIPLPQYIQILWNNINVGCFYLNKAANRQQYFQLLAQAHNPPDIIDFASVFFDGQLVLKLDREAKVFHNLLRDFYQDNPYYLQQIKSQFVCYPPRFILDWERNFCHCNGGLKESQESSSYSLSPRCAS